MTKNDMLEAICKFHADTSRTQQETADGLAEASELAGELLHALVEDMSDAS